MRYAEMMVKVLLAMVAAVGFVLYALVLAALAVPMLVAAGVQYLVQLGEFAPAPLPGLRLKQAEAW